MRTIKDYINAYKYRNLSIPEILRERYAQCSSPEFQGVWISLLPEKDIMDAAEKAEALRSSLDDPWKEKPLLGIPFAVKDNIDKAGCPTTAACPDFSYIPEESAFLVQLLEEQGAILMGKTNLDQFATGLVGVRSPYPLPVNPYNPAYIPGGSSSGSAVAVGAGLVPFSLGTDTAGSGRVPASMNNLVGYKPSRGRYSCRGVIPACKSLDCVSVFANNCEDALLVDGVLNVYDHEYAYSTPCNASAPENYAALKFAVPLNYQLEFFGSDECRKAWEKALERLRVKGCSIVETDFSLFFDTAELLYDGPWVAERMAYLDHLEKERPETASMDLHPVTESIIRGAASIDAVQTFKAMWTLQENLKRKTDILKEFDVFLAPTIGRPYTLEDLEKEPVQANSNLGYYTNFMNLLDMAAVSVPETILKENVPWGITLFSDRDSDEMLLNLAEDIRKKDMEILVFGAHMEGETLNYQLLELDGKLIKKVQTAAKYEMFCLDDSVPVKPGVIPSDTGVSLAGELWSLPRCSLGKFIENVKQPLSLGELELDDGRRVLGFLCSHENINVYSNISSFGGWREFMTAGALKI